MELHQLVIEYRHCLDPIHLSALLTKLAKMYNTADSLERQDVLAVYALGVLQQYPPDGWLLLWLRRAEQLLPQYTPQGFSNAAYGLAKLLATALYSLAQMGQCPTDAWLANYWQALWPHISQTRSSSSSKASNDSKCFAFGDQAVANVLWAAARLQHLPGLTGRDYANILWVLAAAKAKLLPSFRPCHLAMALWALSRLSCQPSPLWLHSFWAASGPQLISFSVAELRATAVAVARLQYEATLLNSSVPFGQSHGIRRSVSSLENVSQHVSDKLQ
eukprot:gene882-1204_t